MAHSESPFELGDADAGVLVFGRNAAVRQLATPAPGGHHPEHPDPDRVRERRSRGRDPAGLLFQIQPPPRHRYLPSGLRARMKDLATGTARRASVLSPDSAGNVSIWIDVSSRVLGGIVERQSGGVRFLGLGRRKSSLGDLSTLHSRCEQLQVASKP